MRELLGLAVALSTIASAQQQSRPVTPPAVELACDLDGDLIEADIHQPEVEQLKHCTAEFRPRLLNVPSDFKDKALDSAHDL